MPFSTIFLFDVQIVWYFLVVMLFALSALWTIPFVSIKLAYTRHFLLKRLSQPGKWAMMHLRVRGIYVFLSMICFLLDYASSVSTIWYFLFFILFVLSAKCSLFYLFLKHPTNKIDIFTNYIDIYCIFGNSDSRYIYQ